MPDKTNMPHNGAVMSNIGSCKKIMIEEHDGRVEWVDAAKGIGIVLVVVGHTLRGLETANVLSFEGVIGQIESAIYLFHMPLMFLLAGLFIHKALPQSWFGYVLKHAQRLVWPLLLWTYIFFLCKTIAGGSANYPVGWKDFPVIPLPPKEHFWFLWALFLGFLIIKVIYALGTALKIRIISWRTAALVSLVFLLLWQSFGLHSLWMQQTIVNLPYILVGMSLRLAFFTNPLYILIASFSGLLATFFSLSGSIAALHSFVTAVSISAAIVSVLAMLSNYITCAWLVVVGRASMAIYLSHTIVSAVARSLLFAMHVNSAAVHLVFGISLGILVPLVAFTSIKDQRILKIMGW